MIIDWGALVRNRPAIACDQALLRGQNMRISGDLWRAWTVDSLTWLRFGWTDHSWWRQPL